MIKVNVHNDIKGSTVAVLRGCFLKDPFHTVWSAAFTSRSTESLPSEIAVLTLKAATQICPWCEKNLR